MFYSDYFKNLPYTWTDNIFFMPKTNSSGNVTPFGQTTSIPLINLTGTNYGDQMNLSIKVNESFDCINISWNSTGSTKPSSQKLNSSYQLLSSNFDYLDNLQIWFWADLDNCNASEKRILNPKLNIQSYCVDCVWI